MVDSPVPRETYPSAPLQIVACEISYQLAPNADLPTARGRLYDLIASEYPLEGPSPFQRLDLREGGLTETPAGFRFLTADRCHSLSIGDSSLIIETTAYAGFESFSESVAQAVRATKAALRVGPVNRIGVRYIDELPVSDLPGRTLEGFFSPAALAAGAPMGDLGQPFEFLTTAGFEVGPDRRAVLRTGLLRNPVVRPEGPLRIPRPSAAPLFVIDIDCAWAAAEATPVLSFDEETILAVLNDLHTPVRELFEGTITEQLRRDVLRKEHRS